MKKYLNTLLLFPLMLISCSTNLSNSSETFNYYSTALNYIQNDSTAIKFIIHQTDFANNYSPLKIAVSSKIIPPDLAEFSSTAIKNKLSFDLNDNHFDYKNSISDSLIKFEKKIFYEPYNDDDITSLSSEDSINAIIFFSKPYKNFLTAMLFFRNNKLLDTELPKYDASLNYLIIFKGDRLDKVLKQIMSP